MTMEMTTDRQHENGGGMPFFLVALEPLSYAEAIGEAVADLRPGLEVLMVRPEELPAEEDFWAPALVLCGLPRPVGCPSCVRWAEYRPYEDPDVVLVDGRAERIPGLQLEDLIGLVDRLASPASDGAHTTA